MGRTFRKTPVLSADMSDIPRFEYTDEEEAKYDEPNEYGQRMSEYMPVYRKSSNSIEVPDNLKTYPGKGVHMCVKDTGGNEILKDDYYRRNVYDEVYRHLPHWGFRVVEQTASDPNVLIVEKVSASTAVNGSYDLFGMDDLFFTKEELLEFADAVEDDVNEKFKSFAQDFRIGCTGIWMEDDNRTITMDYECLPNETEYSTSVKIDMRSIHGPQDIFKYVEPMANLIDKEIKKNEVVGSTMIQASDAEDDEDGIYLINAWLERNFRGKMGDYATNNFDNAVMKAHEFCVQGYYVEFDNRGTGQGRVYDPDSWLKSVGETGLPPESVYNLQ